MKRGDEIRSLLALPPEELLDRGGDSILEDMLILARLRGRQSRVQLAEAFCLFRAWPHQRTYRLLP